MLPNALGPSVRGLVEQGAAAIRGRPAGVADSPYELAITSTYRLWVRLRGQAPLRRE